MSDSSLDVFKALLHQARQQIAAGKSLSKKKSSLFEASADHEQEYLEVYIKEAYIARYWHQACACGSTQTGLEGVYEQRKHPRNSSRVTRRLTAFDQLDPSLPRQQIVRSERVSSCLYCCSSLGFITALLPELIHAQTTQSDSQDPTARQPATGGVREVLDPSS